MQAARTNRTLDRRTLHETIERYIGWREACAAVRDAYARWSQASGQESSVLFAAYNAALDREASAATWYRGAIVQGAPD